MIGLTISVMVIVGTIVIIVCLHLSGRRLVKEMDFEYDLYIQRIRADHADELDALRLQLTAANDECNQLAGRVAELEGQLETKRREQVGSIVGMLPNARRVYPNGRPPCES